MKMTSKKTKSKKREKGGRLSEKNKNFYFTVKTGDFEKIEELFTFSLTPSLREPEKSIPTL